MHPSGDAASDDAPGTWGPWKVAPVEDMLKKERGAGVRSTSSETLYESAFVCDAVFRLFASRVELRYLILEESVVQGGCKSPWW